MSESTSYWAVSSPIGELSLLARGDALTGLYLEGHKGGPAIDHRWCRDEAPFREVIGQLEAYFAGDRLTFELPLAAAGTDFQRAVWRELARIPMGETITYTELAKRVGRPSAVRAVGTANGRNPLSIVVPCHRVIGADGSLSGYAGGVRVKRWLLRHEAATVARLASRESKRVSAAASIAERARLF
ncbi:Methylated-DNA--protein-cysteine methyltransferase [Planctomycetes bacterium Pan216]|uniref:Methylated-DNA--protein-cysteine methyltransferase n=1 Tax=Kolteria novifilia TaxID=2527975 RepID=A0A518B227_9BACT|nr:Methylated-DNA--protein-cysteine methyltransferase [Planctomycetes bacterium Pan216]